jgi:hypothetical protein
MLSTTEFISKKTAMKAKEIYIANGFEAKAFKK